MLNYLRFVLAGDLAGAWASFGGLSAQMTQLGTLLAIASAENAMTAMAYGRAIRTIIETNSRKRLSTDQLKKMVEMLTDEHDAAKKATLHEMAAVTTEQQTPRPTVKGKGDPSRRRTKGGKEKNGKSKGGGKNDTSYTWRNGRPKGKGKQRQNTIHPTQWMAGQLE